MKPGMGKAKGGKYENEVCRILSEWLTGNRKPAVFRRTSGSGSRHTVSSGVELESGDIVGITPEAQVLSDRFFVECKFYNKVQFRHLLHPELKTAKLLHWANDASIKAGDIGKSPIIIFKANTTPNYLMMFRRELGVLEMWNGQYKHPMVSCNIWAICLFDDFLEWLKYESIELLYHTMI